MTNLKKEAIFRLIKMSDMGYTVIIYFIIGVILAKLSDAIYGTYHPETERKKSTVRLCAEILGIIWLDLILLYVARNIVEWIPSPFHGFHGYDHFRLKELNGSMVLGATYLYFQNNLRSKLSDLNKRMTFR
jgi:hypothetical protein